MTGDDDGGENPVICYDIRFSQTKFCRIEKPTNQNLPHFSVTLKKVYFSYIS